MSSNRSKTSWRHFVKLGFSGKNVNKRLQKIEKGSLRHAHKFVTARLDRLSGVRRNVSGWIILVMLLVGISASQWIISKDSYSEVAFSDGGSYSEGVIGPLETLNPIFARSSAERSAAKLLFASLYKYDKTGHIKGDLAESLSMNDKETEYFVKLKENLKWSDGDELNADDVVFTVNLLSSPETNADISGWGAIKSEKIDDRTVKFSLPASYAPFIHALTFPVLPEHILKDVKPSELREHSFGKSPVTSGPFSFRMTQNVTSDSSKKVLYMLANKNYHAGAPKLERFQLYIYPSQNDISKSLRTREITATSELNYNDQPSAVKDLYKAESYDVNNGVYALFNTSGHHLQSREVRRALALSIDTSELRKMISSSSEALHGPILDQFLSQPSSSPKPDVAKAKELLDSAGWKIADGVRQKDGEKLTLNIVAPKNADYEKIANKMADIWKEQLNINSEIRIVDVNDGSQSILQTVLQPRNFDVLIYELVLGGDPDVYAYWHSSQATSNGLNFANYNNPIADDALSSGRSKISSKQRADRYDKFSATWQQDSPAIALYQTKLDYIHLNSVNALGDGAKLVSATDRYADIIYWTVNKSSVYKTP